jgi:hypothetical protein
MRFASPLADRFETSLALALKQHCCALTALFFIGSLQEVKEVRAEVTTGDVTLEMQTAAADVRQVVQLRYLSAAALDGAAGEERLAMEAQHSKLPRTLQYVHLTPPCTLPFLADR